MQPDASSFMRTVSTFAPEGGVGSAGRGGGLGKVRLHQSNDGTRLEIISRLPENPEVFKRGNRTFSFLFFFYQPRVSSLFSSFAARAGG